MRWDGRDLTRALEAATRLVEIRAAQLNALNVFPVPDGDTGTNMAMTMRAALREVESLQTATLGAVARAAARGALFGARGNSGVIVSRYLHGFAESVANLTEIGPREFADALGCAATTAFRSVAQPVEGTILTVARDVADAAKKVADTGGSLEAVLKAVLQEARESVARTPNLLPLLRQAGVVDAGAQGLLTILEGFAQALIGATVDLTPPAHIESAAHRVEPNCEYGYCTEFVIRGTTLGLKRIQRDLAPLGDSLVVAGEGDILRVHIHTEDPGRVLTYAVSLGSLHCIKIENMQEQYERLIADRTASGVASTSERPEHDSVGHSLGTARADEEVLAEAPCCNGFQGPAIVAVAAGSGFRDLFRSLGAATVISGGQSMNPSIEDLLNGIEQAPANQVILIPNNANILLAAQQARQLSRKQVEIVPTKNLAEGVAALLALNYDADLQANAQRMQQAATDLGSAEITRAVRAAKFGDRWIHKGDVIGLVDGQVVAVAIDPIPVAVEVVERLGGDAREVVTVYYGDGVDDAAAQRLADALRLRWPGIQVETVFGGQPNYQYILSVE